ncbi:hypothetical protein ACOMHN_043893 [Nucella lapillus]
MTSSAVSLPSPADTTQNTDVVVITDRGNYNSGEKDAAATRCHVTCNGVIRNSSLPTLSTMSQSSSPPNRRKNVSTVFSSNHRKSWQRSLSNYSQERGRKDAPSPDNRELHELQSRPLLQPHETDSTESSGSAQPHSIVTVYSDDAARKTSPSDDPELGQGQKGQGRGEDLGRGQDVVVCECGDRVCRCVGERSACGARSSEDSFDASRETCRLLNEEDGEGRPALESGVLHDSDTGSLTRCHQQDPHYLRHPSPPSRNNDLSQSSSRHSGSERDSIELSVYPSSSSSRLDNPPSIAKESASADSLTPQPKPSTSSSPSRNQSVSVLQTGNQSNPVSVSSHRSKPKDSDQARKGSSDAKSHKDGRQKRKGQKEQGGGKRIHRQGTRASDGTPDTQPLLTAPQVRVEKGSSSASPDMCLDNSVPRFHSLDSREACSRGSTSSQQRTASASPYQRALSVNTSSTTTTPTPTNLAASLALDTSHLLVENVRPGSPSESLGAPPLNELYRYHVFFSHCAQDAAWVQDMIARLSAPPYGYLCVYTPEVEKDPTALEQSLLCSAMLSERVVLVFSRQYVQDTWFTFEKVLRQLTQMSLHNQRIMGVLLEDCDIPESLGELYFLDSSDPDFFDVFSKRLKTGRLPRSSESISSDLGGKSSVVTPNRYPGHHPFPSLLVLIPSPASWSSSLPQPLVLIHSPAPGPHPFPSPWSSSQPLVSSLPQPLGPHPFPSLWSSSQPLVSSLPQPLGPHPFPSPWSSSLPQPLVLIPSPAPGPHPFPSLLVLIPSPAPGPHPFPSPWSSSLPQPLVLIPSPASWSSSLPQPLGPHPFPSIWSSSQPLVSSLPQPLGPHPFPSPWSSSLPQPLVLIPSPAPGPHPFPSPWSSSLPQPLVLIPSPAPGPHPFPSPWSSSLPQPLVLIPSPAPGPHPFPSPWSSSLPQPLVLIPSPAPCLGQCSRPATDKATLAQCHLSVKVGWDSYLQVDDTADELPPTLKTQGINLEKTEFYAIVHNVSTVLRGSNKLPWVLCLQPLLILILAAALWLPAFIAVFAVQVDDNSGSFQELSAQRDDGSGHVSKATVKRFGRCFLLVVGGLVVEVEVAALKLKFEVVTVYWPASMRWWWSG